MQAGFDVLIFNKFGKDSRAGNQPVSDQVCVLHELNGLHSTHSVK